MEIIIALFANGFNNFFDNLFLWLLLIRGQSMPQISIDGKESNVEIFYYFLNYWDRFNK